jgi:hypothetical protein
MEHKTLKMTDDELEEEAKRLTQLLYKDFITPGTDYSKKFNKNLNNKFKYFRTEIELRIYDLCSLKQDGKDIKSYERDFKHYMNYLKEYSDYCLSGEVGYKNHLLVADKIAKEIIDNYQTYKEKSLIEVMGDFNNKYLPEHNDSVDANAIFYYLDKSFLNNKYKILSISPIQLEEIHN